MNQSNVPKFDPNKPFKVVDKAPKFDPNKPFDVVDEKESAPVEEAKPVDEQATKELSFKETTEVTPVNKNLMGMFNKKEEIAKGENAFEKIGISNSIAKAAEEADYPTKFLFEAREIQKRTDNMIRTYPQFTDNIQQIKNSVGLIKPSNIDSFSSELDKIEDAANREIGGEPGLFDVTRSIERGQRGEDIRESTPISAATRKLLTDTDHLLKAVATKKNTGIAGAIENYFVTGWGTIGKYFSDYANLMEELKANPAIKEIETKLEKMDKGENVDLTTDERILAQAFLENYNSHKELDKEIPFATKVGEAGGTSTGFMLEFFLTGKAGAGTAAKITKGVTEAMAKGAAVSLGKRFGVGLMAKLAHSGIQTAWMPSLWKGTAVDVSKGDDYLTAISNNYYRMFAENFSERIFLKNPWDNSMVGTVDNIIGKLGINIHSEKGLTGTVLSIFEETGEEKISELMTAPLDYNNFNDAWNGYWNWDKNKLMLASVAAMVAPMGVLSNSVRAYDNVKLNRIGKLLPAGVRSDLDVVLDDKKLTLKEQFDLIGNVVQDHIANKTLGDKPGEAAGNIIKYAQQKTKSNIVSSIEDRAKTPTVGNMEEITTEDQAKVDYLQAQGVTIPDGTGIAKVNELYDAEKAKQVPETVESVDKEKETAPELSKESIEDPYKYQDSNQEAVIHSGWEKGNQYRFLLEGAGDVFRESTKGQGSSGYFHEKTNRILKFLTRKSAGKLASDETYEFAKENNPEKIDEMIRLWENQPVKNDFQDEARKLNIAMLKGDWQNVALGIYILEEFISEERKPKPLSSTENISPESETEVPENANILNEEPKIISDINTQRSEISTDEFRSNIELLSDKLKTVPFGDKPFNDLSVDVKNSMKSSMLEAGDDSNIRRLIISLVPVDVMNSLFSGDFSADKFLSDKSMLKDLLVSNDDKLIGRFFDSLAGGLAVQSTILPSASTGRNKELFPALFAGDGDFIAFKDVAAFNRAKDVFTDSSSILRNVIPASLTSGENKVVSPPKDGTTSSTTKKSTTTGDLGGSGLKLDSTSSASGSKHTEKLLNEKNKGSEKAVNKQEEKKQKEKLIPENEKESLQKDEPLATEEEAKEKWTVKKEENKARLGTILDDIHTLIGGKANITGEEKRKIQKRVIQESIEYIRTEFELTGEALVAKVKEFFAEHGYTGIKDAELRKAGKALGYAEPKVKSVSGKTEISRYGTRVAWGKSKAPIKEKYKVDELYNYKTETHGEVNVVVDKFMETATNEEALAAMNDNDIKARIRTGIAVELINRYNEESTPFFINGDKAGYDPIMDKIIAVHKFIQNEYATEIGRDMSYLGSSRVMELLGPYQTAELARRGMEESRNNQMKRKSFTRTADHAKNEVEKEKKKIVEEVIDKIVNPKESKVSPEIEKIRKERSSLIDQWKKARKTAAYSTVVPGLTQADIEFIPQLAASFIKEKFYQTKILIKKIQRVLAQEGIKVSDSDLETLLPKEYEGKPFEEYQQAEDLKKASLSLAKQIFGDVIDKKSPDSDPIVRMVKTLFSKFKETQLDRKKVEGMSDLEKLALAIREKDKYKSVWIEAKQAAITIVENSEKLSDEQKEAAIERIEAAYKNATQFTFSEKIVADLIKGELTEKEMNIGDIVRDHYEQKNLIKADLTESLIKKSGLDKEQAKILADAIDKAFTKLMHDRVSAILKKYTDKATRKTTSKQKKGAEEIIHLASIGAFDNAQFRKAFADAWGLGNLDEADIKYIVTQANKIQKIKSEVLRYDYKQQLLAHIANMQGMDWDALIDGFWYANVLSGMGTQTKNILDAATAATVESFLYSGVKPAQMNRWGKAWLKALKGRGLSNARYTLRTGNHPFEFGTDAPKQAKRIVDAKEALVRNRLAWKGIKAVSTASNGVFNFMMSNDALWNTVAYESILDALVTKDLYKEAGVKWWNRLSKAHQDELNQKIDEKLKITPEDQEIIKKMVEEESEQFKQTQAELGEEQTGYTPHQAMLRTYEIMDEMRPKELVEEARRIAQMTLGNIQPYGTLGWLMSYVSSVANNFGAKVYRPLFIKGEDGKIKFTFSSTESMTLRPFSKVVPFTRIITSIAVRAMNWNPYIMALRGASGQYGFMVMGKQNERFKRKLTQHEKKVLVKKAIILATGYSILYGLTGGDEPEDSWIRVTANGTGDWAKNKQLEAGGWRPYSIQFGDFSMSYQYIYPLNGILGAFGWARDQQLYKGADKGFGSFLGHLAIGSWVSLAQVLFSTPMSGLNSVFDLMTNIFKGEVGSAGTQFSKLLTNIGGGYVAPRALKDMESMYDILAKRSDIQGVTFMEKMSDKIPFIGRNFAGKVEAIDVFGDPFKVKGPVSAVIESNVGRETSDLAQWLTEEVKYFRPIPDIDTEKFNVYEKGGSAKIHRPLTGGSDTEEALWTEYNKVLGQLFKEEVMEQKASGRSPEKVNEKLRLVWDDITKKAKTHILKKSKEFPLDNSQ